VTVCTDNGTNFKSDEFAEFAKSWEFKHVTSSPNHQQGNGKSEAAVKIAKNMMKKCQESGEYFEKAFSVMEKRIFSRMTRNPIPTTSEKMKPKIAEDVTTKIQIQIKQKTGTTKARNYCQTLRPIKTYLIKRNQPIKMDSRNRQIKYRR
jgi:hypothetical protein